MQHNISDCIYGQTLAWITSENSTKQLECRDLLTRSSSLSLDPLSCCLASLLGCPLSTASVRVPSPTANFELLFQLSSRVPFHFRSRREFKSKTLCLVFAPKQTKESSAWRATYIVLQLIVRILP